MEVASCCRLRKREDLTMNNLDRLAFERSWGKVLVMRKRTVEGR